MADPDRAKDIWKDHFEKAMERIDEVLALPIRDESGQGQARARRNRGRPTRTRRSRSATTT